LLSHIDIKRERLAYFAEWQIGGRGDSCVGERPNSGLWDFNGEYAARGGVNEMTGANRVGLSNILDSDLGGR